MNRRIFPLNQNATTWFNYSSYLNWIGSEIQSLFDYLTYWNPDFKINGSSLSCIESNTGNKVEIKSSKETSYQEINLFSTVNIESILEESRFTKNNNKWFFPEEFNGNNTIEISITTGFGNYIFVCTSSRFWINEKQYTNESNLIEITEENSSITVTFVEWSNNYPHEIFLNKKEETLNIFNFPSLRWREGQLIPLMENAYIKLKDFSTLNTIENLEKEHYIEKVQPYTVYFPRAWTHRGVQSSTNLILKDPSFYFKMSQPIASLYLPTTLENKIIFNCFENGQRVAGTNIFTALEFSPSRYFLTIENNTYWRESAITWNEEGAYWDKIDSEPVVHISNIDGQIWSNNYPLMHECYIREKNTNSFEEFIFDNDFSTEITNIANHSTVLYNINAKNITSSETGSWNDFVYVKII